MHDWLPNDWLLEMRSVEFEPQLLSRSAGMKLSAMRFITATLMAFAMLAVPAAQAASPQEQVRTCFWQLANGRDREITCQYPTWLTDEERGDLRKLTRDMLQDLRCTVSVGIARGLVDDALELSDHVFQAPPQPVACDLTLKDSTVQITGRFAPRVVFKDGKAIEATPGLADVKGVNSYLAWPVVQYVNFAPGIRAEMLRMINVYVEQSRSRAMVRK